MSEAVEILIKADDQASAKIAQAAKNTEAAMARNVKAFREVGAQAKASTEFVGTLANMLGGSELAGIAGQIAGTTEKVGQFAEIQKQGTAGAAAFKIGLIGLAATIGASLGKVLGDIVWQTARFNEELEGVKTEATALDARLKQLAANEFFNRKQDIELIQDPEGKRTAYMQLLGDLNRDIATASAQAKKSQKEVEDWANAWKITGDRTEYAAQAEEQARIDRERLADLQRQRDEVAKLAGGRQQELDAIRKSNEEKARSGAFVDSLRQELEYMKATREEQIKIDALRNATGDDRGEAERLLRERDAIIAKAEAEKEAAAMRQKAEEDAKRAAEQAAAEKQRERERVVGIVEAEKERLQLQKIALQQGEEAAKVQELINKGVPEAVAKGIAAEEAAIERLKAQKAEEEKAKQESGNIKGPSPLQSLQASESRLLTRGPGNRQIELMEQTLQVLAKMEQASQQMASVSADSKGALEKIRDNTQGGVALVPTK